MAQTSPATRLKGLALGVLAAVLAAPRARSLRGRAARPARKTGGCRRLRLARRRRKQLARRRTAWSRPLSSPSRCERVRRFVPLQRQALGLSAQAAHLRQDCFVSLRGKHSAWSAQAALLCQDWFREEDAGPIRRWNVIRSISRIIRTWSRGTREKPVSVTASGIARSVPPRRTGRDLRRVGGGGDATCKDVYAQHSLCSMARALWSMVGGPNLNQENAEW